MPALKGRFRRSRDRQERSRRALDPSSRPTPAGFRSGVKKLVFELVAIAFELIAIPARAWMRLAEIAGQIVLAAARAAWPPLLAAWRLSGRLVRFAARVVTPARMGALVAVLAAVALGASQFVDYRAVEVGQPAYQGVEYVTAAPVVAKRDPRSAHGGWLIAIAAAAVVLTAVSYGRRWRLARLLLLLGAIAVAVVVLHDREVGLRTGQAGLAYEGAKSILLDGFWAELAAAVVLAFSGPLLAHHLGRSAAQAGREPRGAHSRARERRHRGLKGRRPARVAG